MAHINELIDFVVNVFIVYDDKILLIHHKKINRWLCVGGHIELDENPIQALFREIKEECGLETELMGDNPPEIQSQDNDFTTLNCPFYLDVHNVKENHKHICFEYFLKSKSDKYILNIQEHNDIRWFSREDLDNPEFDVLPSVKFYSLKAMDMAK